MQAITSSQDILVGKDHVGYYPLYALKKNWVTSEYGEHNYYYLPDFYSVLQMNMHKTCVHKDYGKALSDSIQNHEKVLKLVDRFTASLRES